MIFFRNNQIFFCHSFRHRPLHADLRIVKVQTALIVWMIEIIAFVTKFGNIRQYKKTMSETLWNQKLFVVFLSKLNSIPLSICLAARPQINGNIKNTTLNYSN